MSLRCLMGLSKGKTGGRNSQGRITSFHRGGGSKRLLRKIDLKRSTSSMGIVERIEYDPNRSARIALVRWIEGVYPPRPRHKNSTIQEFVSPSVKESTTMATVSSQFSFASMPGKVVEDARRNVACLPPSMGGYVPVGLPSILPKNLDSAGGSLKTSTKEDLFISALSLPTKLKGGEAGPVSFPRIAVAGAKPAFFAPHMSGEKNMVALCEVQKLKPESIIWQHRIKRQAALSWKSLMGQDTLGLARAAENNVSKLNANQGCLPPFKPMGKGPKSGMKDGVERAPVSYIIASSQLEAGKMVMNCDWSKPSTSGFLRSGQSDANTNQGQGANRGGVEGDRQQQDSSSASPLAYRYEMLDLNSQVGNCIPLRDIRLGTWVHEIECKPGQGAKLVRSAGTFGKIIKESGKKCLVRLPSGVEKFIDSRCRATVGVVSNLNHGAHKLRKAGQSRWLGRRPVVRGVAMNPVDHPHGGGEGRTKGGRPSVSPWGKPTKDGYKTASKRRN